MELNYICTIYHGIQYQQSDTLFNHERYEILAAESSYPAKSIHEKLYICETCHTHLCKNEITSQTVCNKMTLDCIPDELKDSKNRKSLNSKINEEMGMMHEKGEFSKIKGIIRDVPIEAANIAIFYQSQRFPMD